MKICRKCGATNSLEGKFCYNCGELLEVEKPALICGGCSAVNSSASKFCFKCGRALKNDIIFCNSCGTKNNKVDIFCVSCRERIIANDSGAVAAHIFTAPQRDLPRKEVKMMNEQYSADFEDVKIIRKEYDKNNDRTPTIQNIINVEPSKSEHVRERSRDKTRAKKVKLLPEDFKTESPKSSRFKIFIMLLLFGGLTGVLFLPFFKVSSLSVSGYDIIGVFINKISGLISNKPLIGNLSPGALILSEASVIDLCVIICIVIALIIVAASLYNALSAAGALYRLAANKNYKKVKSKCFLFFVLNAVVCGALYACGSVAGLKNVLQSSKNGIFGIEAEIYYYVFTAGLLFTLIMSAALKKKKRA
jgi:ribosomal protein L40E